jgi:hypothetical protein
MVRDGVQYRGSWSGVGAGEVGVVIGVQDGDRFRDRQRRLDILADVVATVRVHPIAERSLDNAKLPGNHAISDEPWPATTDDVKPAPIVIRLRNEPGLESLASTAMDLLSIHRETLTLDG